MWRRGGEEEEEGESHPSGRKTLGQQITGGRGCSAQQCNVMEMHAILFNELRGSWPVSNVVVQCPCPVNPS